MLTDKQRDYLTAQMVTWQPSMPDKEHKQFLVWRDKQDKEQMRDRIKKFTKSQASGLISLIMLSEWDLVIELWKRMKVHK